MKMKIPLSALDKPVKNVLLAMLITLTLGVTLGLITVMLNTSGKPGEITAHYQGDDPASVELIPERYPMPVKQLLITTHNHILGFTFIFGFLGLLIQGVDKLSARMRQILGLEPFASIILTFGSMWGVRFISDHFVWVMMGSSILLYGSFYIMVISIAWALCQEN